jgi:hypothetical protein
MNTAKRIKTVSLSHDAIDRLVVSQAEDDSAWESPVRVMRSKPVPVLIPGDLAARAAFLARLHRVAGLDKWVERIVRERVELEEFAFSQARKELASPRSRLSNDSAPGGNRSGAR